MSRREVPLLGALKILNALNALNAMEMKRAIAAKIDKALQRRISFGTILMGLLMQTAIINGQRQSVAEPVRA